MRCAMRILPEPAMYYQDVHRTIYAAMLAMGTDTPIDPVTLGASLRTRGELDKVGGMSYLTTSMDTVSSSEHLPHYARIVARLHYEREINRECNRMVESKDPSNIEAISAAVRARDAVGRDATERIDDVLHSAMERYGRKEERQLYTVGISTYDKLWGGCLPGEITTWAAAPGVGKSLLMVNIMRHCALQDWPCLLVGTEMSNTEQSDRIVSVFGGPTAGDLRRGITGSPGMMKRYFDSASTISGLGIRLMDKPEPSLADIESAVIESKPKIVFVDYLTHCSLPCVSKNDPLRLRIKEFMLRLHSLARRHGVVVHLTSQLNRMSYAGKENLPPTMGELAESSAVEQESSRVVLLWEPPVEQADIRPDARFLQAINCKSRESRRRTKVTLVLDESNLRITELGGMENDYRTEQ